MLNTARAIMSDIRARRDFFYSTPDHDNTMHGWYVGGNMLDADEREFDIGGGISYGPFTFDFQKCTCGEWHVNSYLRLLAPAHTVRRIVFQWWGGERPTIIRQRFPRPNLRTGVQ